MYSAAASGSGSESGISNVIAVGAGKRLEDGTLVQLDVKAGDRILFGKYAGTEIKLDGVEHLILGEDEVLGIIEG